ncbi:hypothetical protein I6A60_38205 [Frankia sp. AgB1.9]|uniref:hypothetical protein n=1 Tax=unclassified Frankia TaxID=2632575 RepID=UPI001933288D|nr:MULTISPECIES: hypothetical protein [unclassified Frankia]MBL7494047.1 hypothetical protein [Frankia sp. AgW1.1]MBL7553624.1 hypothetical protein [Frankia sp. AgB1.9]MBL7624792.1 hypothetical protein [Frankia sp. AgB1.8]
MSDRELVRAVLLPDNGYAVDVEFGATPGEIATVVATLPPASFVSHLPVGRQGVALLFRRFPKGVPDPEAVAAGAEMVTLPGDAPGGWVPDVSGLPDRGIGPYQAAAGLLLTATDDPGACARIFDLLRREEPETVVALASVVRPRGCRCANPF